MRASAGLLAGALVSMACHLAPAGAVGSAQATRSDVPSTKSAQSAQSADQRARTLLGRMTVDEKFQLIRSTFAVPQPDKGHAVPAGALGSAGFVAGIPRLGIPPLQISDAGLGVANPSAVRPGDGATSLPSGLAVAASWDPEVAYQGGRMIGGQAWRKGFNVLLAGGVNLQREPRNGRNFEYAGEDPLLAGHIVGAAIAGIQSRHVLSTIKHFALNDQETGRNSISAELDLRAMRESDLLAFELAIERARPGAVMCAYNRVNRIFACENPVLLNDVLKRDWAYPGFVMSDWGGVHSAEQAANAGLDQESAGESFDPQVFFDQPLRQALQAGTFTTRRLDDMVLRILRSMFNNGLFEHPPQPGPIDYAADQAVAQRALEAGAVLLRNEDDTLPLRADLPSIAVVGGHADQGTLSGGGSSLVLPRAGNAVPGLPPTAWPGPVLYDPTSVPLQALREQARTARVEFASGDDVQAAATLAGTSKVAVVFVRKWAAESFDSPDLKLPDGQDALVSAVARANPRTIVVIESNGPVDVPWLPQVAAVLQAWYPGSGGGAAIANLLFGRSNPAGHLPFTWPRDLSQLPRPQLPGAVPDGAAAPPPPDTVDYRIEAADVGYRWFQRRDQQPLFAFGHGLSYTRFSTSATQLQWRGNVLQVGVDVRNEGALRGAHVVQVYATVPGSAIRRLAGFAKVILQPGQHQQVTIALERRLLSDFDEARNDWVMPAGTYRIQVGRSALDLDDARTIEWPASARR